MKQPGEPQWLAWSRKLQAIAQIGLTFTTNAYDIERYKMISDLAVQIAAAQTGAPPAAIRDFFSREINYPTPKVDVRGACFRGDELLLVKSADDGEWTLPGGWADVNDAPSRAVEREVREESGYRARTVKLLALFDNRLHGQLPFALHVYKAFFLCEIVGGQPALSHETAAVAFFAEDTLPPLSGRRTSAEHIACIFEHHRHPDRPTDFD